MIGEGFSGLSSAVRDFHRARRQANLEAIMARLTGRSADLLSYEEVRRQLKARQGPPQGLQEIPLDAIVGSVGRYEDFTRSFLPRQDSDEQRWARVKQAMTGQGGLPPIEVYKLGDVYFVLDGNHRVSAARQLGAAFIDAFVTEVHTKVPLTPDIQPDEIIIKARYAEFLEHTGLDQIRPEADLSVTAPGPYRVLEEHIEVHRYFMGLEQKREIPYAEAVAHWYDEVYLPIVELIREQGILRDFPDRTETDLYVWVMEHRTALHNELGLEIEFGEAALDLAERHSRSPRRLISRVAEKALDVLTPDELESGPPPGQWRTAQVAARREDRLFLDVLVPISGTEAGWHALGQALEVVHREGARLSGLHLVGAETEMDSEPVQRLRAEFERRCEAAGITADIAVEVGEVARKVCERARWIDLVVVGLTHLPAPHPVARLGSGFRTLVQRCPTPILVVQGPRSPLNRVLLAYDGSPKAEEALFVSTYLAGQWGIPLVVVSVQDKGQVALETLGQAQAYLEEHGVRAVFVEREGPVSKAILETADEHHSNLIIMGGYGFRPAVHVVLGSVVDEVLRETEKPVLICR
jgi:nucleotide-binding universal stress UspA family protein